MNLYFGNNISKFGSCENNIKKTNYVDNHCNSNNVSNNQRNGRPDYSVTKFKSNIRLLKDVSESNRDSYEYNIIHINNNINVNEGDVIEIEDTSNNTIKQVNIVSNLFLDNKGGVVVVLRNPLKYNFLKNQTDVNIINSSNPNIIEQPNPELSIENTNNNGNNYGNDKINNMNNITNSEVNYDYSQLKNREEYLYNYGNQNNNNIFQGPPYGKLNCRSSNINNPLGNLTIDDYDEMPSNYGSCNVGDTSMNSSIKNNYNYNLSQRVNDLLYDKGNSQGRFTPMAIDTNPNQRDQFSFFCYQNPSNLINPKYASIFVNDPAKFKLISSLSNATGTENGGGGGG
jgi:hypothetical protein